MPNSNKYTPDEPIAAIATALAPSAIAAIRTSGKNCIELVSKVFSSSTKLTKAKGNTIVHGWIVDNTLPDDSKLIDEVVLGIYRAPKSFTGEDVVEIFCHGGTASVVAIFNLLLKSGFRQAERGEFTFRRFINGKTDLTRAEAIREIIDSHTNESRSRASGRLCGALETEINSVKKLIVDTLAEIEVEIEYPEDEETIADSFNPENLKNAEARLQKLSDSWKAEKLYQDGARVMLCGRTNAGKSSLFNALLKEDRAIVSDIAGTTRDWLESWVSFNGIPARLFDTAGLRETEDAIEQQGVEMTKDLCKDADLILYIIDSSVGVTKEDKDFINTNVPASSKIAIGENDFVPFLIVWNKCDISGASPESKFLAKDSAICMVSAVTGEGLANLAVVVHDLLLKSTPTDRTQAGLGSERQKIAVDEALESVRHALANSSNEKKDLPLDAVVQDLENALDSLSEITGETKADDILESVFSRFCVGK